MATFRVKTPIRKDGEDYQPGETIELTAKEAAAMPWAVEPAPAKLSSNGNGGASSGDLNKFTKAELVEFAATKHNLKLDANTLSKDELLAAITEAQKK